MEASEPLLKQLAALIDLLSKSGSPLKRKEEKEKPREVVQTDTKVEIDSLSDNVKKFLTGLFKFEQPDVKKQVDKKTHFWMDILTLLGAALLGAWGYLKNTVLPYFTKLIGGIMEFFGKLYKLFKEELWNKIMKSEFVQDIAKFFRRIGTKFEEMWALIKESKFGQAIEKLFIKIEDLFKGFGKLFSAEGKIGKLFTFEWIKNLFEPVIRFFSESGVFKAVFTKLKVFARVFEKLAIFLVPIFALFDFKEGWDDEMKRSGNKAQAVSKGLIAFAVNILTLGFINFEDIKKSIDRIMNDFENGNIFEQLRDVILLIPETIFKLPVKVVGWIVGFFNKEAGNKISAWLKDFSLGELLENIGTAIGEWVGDYIITPIQNLWYKLEHIFTKSIPDAFNKFFTKITDFFDKIVNFDYASILEKIPGYAKIKKWFDNKETTARVNTADKLIESAIKETPMKVGRIAQDYISRPGQPAQHFSSKDTVIGFKEGGPILEQLTSSISYGKKFNEQSLKYYGDNIKVLSQMRDAIDKLAQQLREAKNSNVVVSNKTNNIVIPEMSSGRSFRQAILGN